MFSAMMALAAVAAASTPAAAGVDQGQATAAPRSVLPAELVSSEPASLDHVEIVLRADAPGVHIDRFVDGAAVPICVAPCNRVLPRDGVYVISGPGLPPTRPFTLNGSTQTTLAVRIGSSVRRDVGLGVLSTGMVALLGGGLATAVIGIHDLATRPDDAPGDPWAGRLAYVSLAGIPMIVTGAILMLTSPTRVTTSDGVTFTLGPSESKHAWSVALTPRGLQF